MEKLLLLSSMTVGHQCRKTVKSEENEAGGGAGLERQAKAEDVINMKPANSGALHLEAGSAYLMINVAKEECYFVRNAAFSEPRDLYELEKWLHFVQKLGMILADPPTALAVRRVRPPLLTMCPRRVALRTP